MIKGVSLAIAADGTPMYDFFGRFDRSARTNAFAFNLDFYVQQLLALN
jgi:hypothetical protein